MRCGKMDKKEKMEAASLMVSAASLGVSVAALCLNEKKKEGRKMAARIDPSDYTNRKDLKKAYAKEIRRTAVSEIGYTGPIIVLNEKGKSVKYKLVPLKNKVSKKESKKPITKNGQFSWVAMDYNPSTGESHSVVCKTKEEAKRTARGMSRYKIQGIAKIDTSKPFNVGDWLKGKKGTVEIV